MRRMWRGTLDNGGIDFVASIDTIAYDNVLFADSMAFDMDMGRDLWLNRQRWTRLVRQYLDLGQTQRFLDRAADIGLGEGKRGVVTTMHCADVLREAKKHRWGNCMLAFTYRGLRGRGDRPTLALHSRVSYIAYIGGLDLGLAHVLAREIGERIEVPVEDFSFVWHVDALQFHGFKSLPLLFRKEYIEDLEDHRNGLREEFPTIKLVGRWYDQIVDFTERGITDNKYGPLKRVMRRYREYVSEDYLPSVPVDSLDLGPLYR
jgi:hypothetical protein